MMLLLLLFDDSVVGLWVLSRVVAASREGEGRARGVLRLGARSLACLLVCRALPVRGEGVDSRVE